MGLRIFREQANSESTSFNLATSTGTRPSQPEWLPLQLGAWPHRLLEALLDPRLVAYPGPPRSQEQVAPPSGQTLGSAVSRRGSLSLALRAAASFCSVLHTCCVNMDLVSVGGLAQSPTCTGTWGTRCVLAAACQHLPPSWSHLLTGTQFSPAAGDAAGGGRRCGGVVAGLWLDLTTPPTGLSPAVSAPSLFPDSFSSQAIGCLGSACPTSWHKAPPSHYGPAPSASGTQTLRCKVPPRMPVPLVVGGGSRLGSFTSAPGDESRASWGNPRPPNETGSPRGLSLS